MGNRFYGRPVTATTSTSGTIVSFNFTNPELAARPKLPVSTTNVQVTAIGYFNYVGLWPAGSVWKHWAANLTAVGTNQQGEVGVFVSPLPPNRQAQTLFQIAAVTARDSMTSGTGTKRNTDAFNATLYTDSFVWAGMRHSGGGTQPTYSSNALDLGDGYILVEPTGVALTGTTSFFATLYTGGVPYQGLSLV